MNIQKIKNFIKYKLNPMDPSVDSQDYKSRRNWILYMAHRDKRYPVSLVHEKFNGLVSKVTTNTDFQSLEKDGLIRREKDRKTGKSYVVPLFQDSGEALVENKEKKRQLILDKGLPALSIILFMALILILFSM